MTLEERVQEKFALEALPSAVEDSLNLILDESQKDKERNRQVFREALVHKSSFTELMKSRRIGDDPTVESKLRRLADVVLELAPQVEGQGDILPLAAERSAFAIAPVGEHNTSAALVGNVAPAVNCDSPVLRLDRVSSALVGTNSAFVLEDVSLALGRDEILSVIGPNGSGKSTLMRIMAGELAPSGGAVEYPTVSSDSQNWVRIKRRIAYVPQFAGAWVRPLIEVLRYTAAISGYTGSGIL